MRLKKQIRFISLSLLAMNTLPTYAANGLSNPNISLILSGGYTARDDEFAGIAQMPVDAEGASGPSEGFWLGESELGISANIDEYFYGKFTLAFAQDEEGIETELEEAFIQTLDLPYGLGVRAGHFLANMGYQNSQHGHTNPFVDRPLVFKAFLGESYHDNGMRINWIAPMDHYVELGAELLQGTKFPANSDRNIGVRNLFVKTGDDLNDSNSWQLGLSYAHIDNAPSDCELEEEDSQTLDLCQFAGSRRYLIADGTWKWAPQGNYKYQSLTLNAEYFQVHDQGEFVSSPLKIDDQSTGWYASAVYQFAPAWSAGVRYSAVTPSDNYGNGEPKAADLLLTWHPSHFSQLRLQVGQENLTGEAHDVLSLQYQVSLGAHNAHTF